MFHCAWGWGGEDDGYFLSNVFDLTTYNWYPDYYASVVLKDYKYNHYLKIITYDKPNN